MNNPILVIEDEKALVMALQDRLESEGYQVEARYNGINGEAEAIAGTYSCIILDVMLPGRDGFQVCRNIREKGIITPILMLTARDTSIDTVMGLKLGADDYLAKPFDMQVLLARIESLLRRSASSQNTGTRKGRHTFGPFVLDTEQQLLTCHGSSVPLNATEYQLLRYLAEHEGSTVSRVKLLEEVWGYELQVSTRTVDVHIARLRQRLGEGTVPRYIRTVRGMGYRFTSSEDQH